MDERILGELQQLQQAAARLKQFAANMQQPLDIEPVEREDSSGAVSVRVGSDGLPDQFRITEDWRRRVNPGDVGQAVVDAYGRAMNVRMRAWAAQIERKGLDEAPAPEDAFQAPQEAGSAPSPSEVPSMSQLAEEAIAVLDGADDAPQEQTPPKVSPARRVVISLSGGALNSCAVDVRWARRQSARSLATALGAALERARTDWASEAAEREATQQALRQRAQNLYDGALAAMRDPDRRLAD